MGRIRKFFNLSLDERWLLLKATVLSLLVRLSLWLLPFSSTRRLFSWASQTSQRLVAKRTTAARIAWMVGVASRLVPGATHCLTQAMATHILLVRRGYPAKLCFGVLRSSAKNFIAHAWVECNGTVVIGGSDARQRYTKLQSPLDPAASISSLDSSPGA